jgi:hypothetical protein
MAIFILLPKYGIPRIFYGLAFFQGQGFSARGNLLFISFFCPQPFFVGGQFFRKGKIIIYYRKRETIEYLNGIQKRGGLKI